MKRIPLSGWAMLKQLWSPLGMARRWLLVYIALILLPATVLLYIYYQRSATILEEEVSRTMLQTMKQAGLNLNYRLQHVEDISNSAFMNPNLHQYLAIQEESIGQQLLVVKDLRDLVETFQTNTDVFRMRLFIDKSKLYAGEHVNFFPLDKLKGRPWYDEIVKANGSIVWTGDYRESFIDRQDAVQIYSCARMLRDPNQYDRISGVLMVDVAEKTVTDILSDIDLAERQQIYLVDGKGAIVSHVNRAIPGDEQVSADLLKSISGSDEGIRRISNKKNDSYLIYETVRPTGWKLVAEVPVNEISSRVAKESHNSIIATVSVITFLILLLVLLLLMFVIRWVNRRIHRVIKNIRSEGIERLDERIPAAGEFLMLERSVEHLILRVKLLMEETYRAQMHEREAQLRALQAQINPHFLYNTLDTINWIAIGRQATDISQMIDALSKYFRLSLNKGRDVVSVTDELSLAQVYLDIQNTRFPGSFSYRIEADSDLRCYLMPKLTLQPIVENALIHGIRKTKEKKGTIRIQAGLDDEELVLTVEDDGIGMETERARRLLVEPLPDPRPDGMGSSYGLYNVHERIRLLAGEAYGLEIISQPGEGTKVVIRLKAVTIPAAASDSGHGLPLSG